MFQQKMGENEENLLQQEKAKESRRRHTHKNTTYVCATNILLALKKKDFTFKNLL